MNNKTIGYVRVSKDDQINSIEVQTQRITDYCKFHNLELLQIITDRDVSGFVEFHKRPGGEKAYRMLENKKASTIVALRPDRLFRNVQDAITVTDEWNKNQTSLHIIDMGGVSFTTKTAIGKMIFTTLIVTAQFERDIAGERTSVVLQAKKAAGKVYGRAMLGFDNVDGKMVPNPQEQETIKTILELSKTNNPNKVAQILNDSHHKTKSGKPFFRSTIKSIINNPIYKEAC